MKKLNLDWITDVIGEDYKNWKKGDVVTVKAQTGTGKTHFIKTKLIPYMKSYEKMLLVCNRVNLKRQSKKDLFTYFNIPLPNTLKELDDVVTVGNVTITSYQAIAEFRNKANYGQGEAFDLNEYDYIVCDEAHHIISDSGFANKTDLAFMELIRNKHTNAVKVFITATMDEIIASINKSIEDIKAIGFGSYSDIKIHNYAPKGDYSYLNIKYFKDLNDITKTIKNDRYSDYKWLVFVHSAKNGQLMSKELDGICSNSYIDKNTDIEENEDLKSIIIDSKFNSKVLISTKCLDNGINIKDEQVKNIVVMTFDKTTFIQEIGRIRIDIENAPEINLFIPTFDSRNFRGLLNDIEKKKAMLDEYEEDKNVFNMKYNRGLSKMYDDIFYIDKDGGFTINMNGYVRLYKDKLFMEDMEVKFKSDKDFAYVKEQLSWLELEDSFNVANLLPSVIDDVVSNELQNFLEDSYENEIPYTKDYFLDVMNSIIESDDNLRVTLNKLDGRKSRSKGQAIYNKLFTELYKNEIITHNFIVSSKPKLETTNGKRKKITYWVITIIES